LANHKFCGYPCDYHKVYLSLENGRFPLQLVTVRVKQMRSLNHFPHL